MATDHGARPSDDTQPKSERAEPLAHEPEADLDAAEAHDLTYIRTRRARAHDPRRTLNVAANNDASGPVALRRAVPPPPAEPAPAPPARLFGRSRTFWLLLMALFALVVAGITFALFYASQSWVKHAGVAPEVIRASVPVSSLHMHVEVQGERVLVSWDPRASGVTTAAGGRLTIEDAGQRHVFPLDATQASNGSVLYLPASGDVTFRLEIRNASGATFSDSLRVVDPAKAALLAQKKAPSRPAEVARHGTTRVSPKPRAQIAAGPSGKSSEQRVARAAAPRHFKAPHLTPDPLDMPAAAPAVVSPGQAVAGSANPLSAETLRRALASEAPPPPTLNATGEVIGTASVAPRPNSDLFRAPQPVKQVMPRLSSSLFQAVASGTEVEVQVRIDKRGRVKRARIAPESRNMNIDVQKAALDAAKQWRFTPAWRNGERVPSERRIVFRF